MLNIGFWNIRGMNKSIKQKEVKEFISSNKMSVCAVLESHVTESKLKSISKRIFGRWEWVSNTCDCVGGTRIIIGWNPEVINLKVLNKTDQVVHCFGRLCDSGKVLYLSFIYGDSYDIRRRDLWKDLIKHKVVVKDDPWVLMGDFNVALNNSDYMIVSSKIKRGVVDF